MIIIDMSERKYKQTLRDYTPPFEADDWRAMQALLQQSRPKPWWRRRRLALAASLLLLLFAGGYVGWQRQLGAGVAQTETEVPLAPVMADKDDEQNKNTPEIQPVPEMAETAVIPLPVSAEEGALGQHDAVATGGSRGGFPQGKTDQPTPSTPSEQQIAVAIDTSAIDGFPAEEAPFVALITLPAKVAGLPLQAVSGQEVEQQRALLGVASPKVNAVTKGGRFWRAGMGAMPTPLLGANEVLQLPPVYLAHTRLVSDRLAVGWAVDYYRYQNQYKVVDYDRSDDYWSASLSVRADYYWALGQHWAAYAGTHLGYRLHSKQGWGAVHDAEFSVEEPPLGQGSNADAAVVGKQVRQSGVFAGLHVGVQRRLYKRLGAFAEVGYQPSLVRVGVLWAH